MRPRTRVKNLPMDDQTHLRTPVSILLIEDNKQTAKGIIRLISSDHNFQILEWSKSAEEALQYLELAAKLPDLIIVDHGLPGISGTEGLRRVKARWPAIRIVIYTVFEQEAIIIEAIKAGADGYLLKDTQPELFMAELKVVMLGGAPMTPRVARKIIQPLNSPGTTQKEVILTDREIQILNYIGSGFTYTAIAEEIQISQNTVRRHIENIYRKLKVHNRAQAISRGRKEGMID